MLLSILITLHVQQVTLLVIYLIQITIFVHSNLANYFDCSALELDLFARQIVGHYIIDELKIQFRARVLLPCFPRLLCCDTLYCSIGSVLACSSC